MNNKGFAALISILVIASVVLIIASSAASLGVGQLRNSLDSRMGERVSALAEACAEDALLRLRDDARYDPNGASQTIPGVSGECMIDVQGTGSMRGIEVQALFDLPPEYKTILNIEVQRTGRSIVVTKLTYTN